jgi:hypothetical protein
MMHAYQLNFVQYPLLTSPRKWRRRSTIREMTMKAVATVASAHVGAYSSDLSLLLELDDDEEEEEVDSLAPMVSLSLPLSLPLLPVCTGHYGAHTPPTSALT